MLLRMQTIDTDDLVSGSFEACAAYSTGGDGSPLCAGCGWLESEHDHGVAELHQLPARTVPRLAPKRLAS